MTCLSIDLRRRQLCVGTALGAGLSMSGLAHAKKPEFAVILDFPAGEAPTQTPINNGRYLCIMANTRGWRIYPNTGRNKREGAVRNVYHGTYSSMIALAGVSWVGYGTQTLGGSHKAGTVYWWRLDRHWVHDFYTFDHRGGEGLHPMGGLVQGFDAAMYGTTHDGGAAGAGTIFRLTRTGEFAVLHSFDPASGGGLHPTQCLTKGPDGNYYGATESGGAFDQGTLYRMTPDGTVTTLFSFNTGASGQKPHGALTLGADGLLYGLTALGGDQLGGTLFSLSPDGAFEVLHSFGPGDGTQPMSNLLAWPDGTLYGTCSQGGEFGRGTVFKFHPAHRKLVVRHHFAADGSEGASPMSALMVGTNGYLYGTARDGGADGGGTLYRIAH